MLFKCTRGFGYGLNLLRAHRNEVVFGHPWLSDVVHVELAMGAEGLLATFVPINYFCLQVSN